MSINQLSTEQLYALRKEITLNSLFIKDYNNSFGINPEEVCNFFNGYVEYLYEIAEENLHSDYDFFEIVEAYDTDNNLLNYWLYFAK